MESFRFGERRERALEVAELQLGLRAQHERGRMLLGIGRDREHDLARLARIAEQERDPRQSDPQVAALREAAHGVLELPAGAGSVAGLHGQLRNFEQRLGGLGQGVAQLVDRLECAGAVAVLDRRADFRAGRLGPLLCRPATERQPSKQEPGEDERGAHRSDQIASPPRTSRPGRAPVGSPFSKVTSPAHDRGAVAVDPLDQAAPAGGRSNTISGACGASASRSITLRSRLLADLERAAVGEARRRRRCCFGLQPHRLLERDALRRARGRAPSA